MTRGKGIVNHLSGGYTFQFGPHKCRPLAGLDMQKLNNFIDVVVVANAQSLSDI